MKRVLLVLVALILLIVIGVAIFIATFDADRYRPLLVDKLQQALGKPVTLERLSLAWRGGIAVELDGLSIADEAGGSSEPLLQLESASVLVRFAPLLRREVQVSSVLLKRPQVHIARDAQGRINLLGLTAAASPAAVAGQPAAAGESQPPTTAPSGAAPAAAPAVSFAIDSLRIQDGTIHWVDAVSTPVDERWLKAVDMTVDHIELGKPMDIKAAAALDGTTPNVQLSGRLVLPVSGSDADPRPEYAGSLSQAKVTLERVPLDALLPVQPAGAPQLQGTLTLSFEGDVPTFDPAQLVRAISGSGRIRLDEAKITHLNLLREVFNRLSILPGLVERLKARLPEAYRAKLDAEDTVLAPVDFSMQLERGAIRLDGLTLKTDTVSLSGTIGTVGLDGAVHLRSTLLIDPAFSSAIIQSVNELQQLTNSAGEMAIPLSIEGQAPHIVPVPDLQYIASKILATKAINLLDQLLRPKEEPSEGVDSSQPQPSQPAEPSSGSGSLLEQLLQKSLQN